MECVETLTIPTPCALSVDDGGHIFDVAERPNLIASIAHGWRWVVSYMGTTLRALQCRDSDGTTSGHLAWSNVQGVEVLAVSSRGVIVTSDGSGVILVHDAGRGVRGHVARDWVDDHGVSRHLLTLKSLPTHPTILAEQRRRVHDRVTHLVFSDTGRTLVVGLPDRYLVYRVDRCHLYLLDRMPQMCNRIDHYALAVSTRGTEISHVVHHDDRLLVSKSATHRASYPPMQTDRPLAASYAMSDRVLCVGDGSEVALHASRTQLLRVAAGRFAACGSFVACLTDPTTVAVHHIRWSPKTHTLFGNKETRRRVPEYLWVLAHCGLPAEVALLVVQRLMETAETVGGGHN